MPMEDAAWGAASSGWPTPIPMIQIKILSFSEKSVHLSVNLPPVEAHQVTKKSEGKTRELATLGLAQAMRRPRTMAKASGIRDPPDRDLWSGFRACIALPYARPRRDENPARSAPEISRIG
jgi:hypothetical protein